MKLEVVKFSLVLFIFSLTYTFCLCLKPDFQTNFINIFRHDFEKNEMLSILFLKLIFSLICIWLCQQVCGKLRIWWYLQQHQNIKNRFLKIGCRPNDFDLHEKIHKIAFMSQKKQQLSVQKLHFCDYLQGEKVKMKFGRRPRKFNNSKSPHYPKKNCFKI